MRWGALVGALALATAACGSTVQQAAQRAANRQASATGEAGLNGSGSTVPGADQTGAFGLGTSSGSGTGTGNRSSSGSGQSGASGSADRATGNSLIGPGVSATEINVGIIYANNTGAANAAIGAAHISQGDEKTNYQILIDDINAHGGVAGRKLVGVFHAIDATSADTTDNQFQAACDDLTQDHKVFVVFAGNNDVLLQCLQNRGVLSLTSNLTMADAAEFRRFPNYVEMDSLNLDRIAAAEVAGLNAQGWFSGWDAATGTPGPARAKVGVVTFDLPAFAHATDQVLVPALAKLGYGPAAADVIRVPAPKRTSDISAAAAGVSSAVLKFRSDGVSHVIIIEASGTLTLLFGNNADSQRFYPRYGANSQNGQQALIDSGGFPKSQLPGTLGVGWQPTLDISPSENTPTGPYSNDAQRRCLALYKAHGVTFADTNAAGVGFIDCNDLWFFQFVMRGVAAIQRDAFMAAVNRVGSSYKSLSVIPTYLDANHHDGIAAVRYWVYVPQCGCMRYASGDIPA
jgi:hypothetical protein